MLQLGHQVSHSDLASMFRYQFQSLILSAVVVALIRMIVGRKLQLLKVGKFSSPSRAMAFLGVKQGESWLRVGTTFAVFTTAATAAFMYFGYQSKLAAVHVNVWLLAFVIAIPLSALNAFNEELITRWSIAEAAHEAGLDKFAPWVSAAVFGTAHFFGIPGGPIGSLMAGFLAWLLSRSIQDTRGIGWAVALHFLQDVIILTVAIGVAL